MLYFRTEYPISSGGVRTAYGKNDRDNIRVGDSVLLGSSGPKIRASVVEMLDSIPAGKTVNWAYLA